MVRKKENSMTTLVWLFWGMSVLIASYASYRVTRWRYISKIEKLVIPKGQKWIWNSQKKKLERIKLW